MTPERLRPRLHFTAQSGWTNDPHGIIFLGGEYHMFFQYNPSATTWSPGCHWGHAVSRDLITWQELEVALSPREGEVGCWSGSVVVDGQGPVIAYTRIAGDGGALGQVALARAASGMRGWVRTPAHAVIDGPPAGCDIVAFRDPQVRGEGAAWKAILGAGTADGTGCALQYSSPDLENWTFDGVLAARSSNERDPVWTGQVWECPQLLRIGDHWVLLMSAWARGLPHSVAYAIGDYDGIATFTARRYGRFTHGGELYATTTFRDAEGRPCALSWLRERGNVAPRGSPWCSAMSLPHVLSVADGKLMTSQHPALESVLASKTSLGDAAPGGHLEATVPGPVWRLRFSVNGYTPGGFGVSVNGDGRLFAVNTAGESLAVTDDSETVLMTMPVSTGNVVDVDIVVDADIIEIIATGTEGIGSTRVPVVSSGVIRISAGGGAVTGARLSAYA